MRWIVLIVMAVVGCEPRQEVWHLDSTYSHMLLGSHEYYEAKTGKDPGTTVDWLQLYVTPAGKSYERTLENVTSQQLVFETDDPVLYRTSSIRGENRGQRSFLRIS
jgi:hypothetical protein